MKNPFLPILILSLTLTFSDFSYAQNGGNSGGGGTSVQTQYTTNDILWDLFANNSIFVDFEKGDQLPDVSSEEIRKVDISAMQSFVHLKKRLESLKEGDINWLSLGYANLYNFINQGGFLDNPDAFPLYAMGRFPVALEELYLSYDYANFKYTARPLAHFDDRVGAVFVNFQRWNALGLQSQAGFILHERLRQLQTAYPELTNELIQSIVAFVIDRRTAIMLGAKPNDSFFKRPFIQLSKVSSFDALTSRFIELIEMGIFVKHATEFQNPRTIGSRNTVKTGINEIILDSKNCNQIVSGFESVTNTFRPKLYCNKSDQLSGVGDLTFKSDSSNGEIIEITIESSLWSANDSGSEIGITLLNREFFLKWELVFRNQNSLYVMGSDFQGYHQQIGSTKVDSHELNKFNVYTLRLNKKTGEFKVLIEMNGESVTLKTGNLGFDLGILNGNFNWRLSINNNSTIKRVSIKNHN